LAALFLRPHVAAQLVRGVRAAAPRAVFIRHGLKVTS